MQAFLNMFHCISKGSWNIYLYVAVYLRFTIYDFRFSLIPLFTRVITIKKWWNLYFNDSVNIASYINYCNSNFEYNKALDKWIMPDGYLGLFIPWMKSMKYLAILKEWYMYEHKTIWFVIYSEWIYIEVVLLHYDIKHLFISIF